MRALAASALKLLKLLKQERRTCPALGIPKTAAGRGTARIGSACEASPDLRRHRRVPDRGETADQGHERRHADAGRRDASGGLRAD